MDRSFYKENREQGFPYILPVLRSYKQSAMFIGRPEEKEELHLPEISSRLSNPNTGKLKRKKKATKKNLSTGPIKGSDSLQYSPRFRINKRNSIFH